MSLTDKQRAFVREYLIDFNGTQAAIRAGYSENRARQTAYELLETEEIKGLVEKGQQELTKKADVTKRDKLNLLDEIMYNNEERTLDRLKAIEVHNKMLGHNEPDKVEHSGTEITINYNKPKK